jgi:hypothetical protein
VSWREKRKRKKVPHGSEAGLSCLLRAVRCYVWNSGLGRAPLLAFSVKNIVVISSKNKFYFWNYQLIVELSFTALFTASFTAKDRL